MFNQTQSIYEVKQFSHNENFTAAQRENKQIIIKDFARFTSCYVS